MNSQVVITSIALVVSVSAMAGEYLDHSFQRHQVSPYFWGEGADFGDFNKDGEMDIVSGPYWYEGPGFEEAHEFMPADHRFERENSLGEKEVTPGYAGSLGDINQYSANFFAYAYDFNSDGWTDILIFGFPGKESIWYENPKGRKGHWQRHVVHEVTDNESPVLADITGDGKPEIVCMSEGYGGYAEADWSDPSRLWRFHRVTTKQPWQRFTHGQGIGDVNGDGRMDYLAASGWWEQPASLEGDPVWKRHEFRFGTGGAQMYAYDFDNDGDNDVVTSLTAHGYGLAWYENHKVDGEITFKEHIIMNKEPAENRYGLAFSQLHAVELLDFDADGVKDIITGKRFWAHGPKGDPDPNGMPVLYWFKTRRYSDGRVDFVPHLIDGVVGVGTQVTVEDINDDGFPEVLVGNKRGTYLIQHATKSISRQAWEASQPKPFAP